MIDVSDCLREIAPRLEAEATAQGARFVLELDETPSTAEARLGAPLQVILLALAKYAVRDRTFNVRSNLRAGGDTEITVEGLALPTDFPASSEHRDLWAFAEAFLSDSHRARIGQDQTRVLLLLPAYERAAALRRSAEPQP